MAISQTAIKRGFYEQVFHQRDQLSCVGMESARKPVAGCTLRCAIDVSEPGADSGRAALARAQHRREHSDLQLSRTIILRSLPVKEPARLVLLVEGNEGGVTATSGSTTPSSYPFNPQFHT